MKATPPKILFASNEVVGMGHLRIVLRLAACIETELSDASMLLLTASTMAHAFPLPKGLDVIQIPGIDRSNDYTSYRPLRLPLTFEEVKKLRERIIGETARIYRPDLFLVDYRPGGVAGELVPTLRALKQRGQTALVLLLRDILDGPGFVRVQWRADQAMQALKYYDEIWVYGCQKLYDPIREYQLPPETARKIRFCGYLDIIDAPVAPSDDIRRTFGIARQPLVLVTLGSGRIGFPVLDSYVRALAQFPNELNLFSLVVGGPSLPIDQRDIIVRQCEAISSRYPLRRVHFVDFLPNLLDYMAAADVVVSMGGYNAVTEILRLGKCAVVVPHASSHDEQLIRASLLENFGLIRMIHPDQLSPQRLVENILAALQDKPPTHQRLLQLGFDFDGLQHIKDHVMRLLKYGATT
jgi:predicted glycosyltransferase